MERLLGMKRGETVARGRGGENNRKRCASPKTMIIIMQYDHYFPLCQNATFAVAVNGVSAITGPVREDIQQRCRDFLNWEGSV